jgi:hypothetical protein
MYTDGISSLVMKAAEMPIALIHATLGVTFFVLWAMIVQFAWPGKSADEIR